MIYPIVIMMKRMKSRKIIMKPNKEESNNKELRISVYWKKEFRVQNP